MYSWILSIEIKFDSKSAIDLTAIRNDIETFKQQQKIEQKHL